MSVKNSLKNKRKRRFENEQRKKNSRYDKKSRWMKFIDKYGNWRFLQIFIKTYETT